MVAKNGRVYDRPESVYGMGPSLDGEWLDEKTLVLGGGGEVVLKGIIRGGDGLVHTVIAPNFHMISDVLILPEWIYYVEVNGVRAA